MQSSPYTASKSQYFPHDSVNKRTKIELTALPDSFDIFLERTPEPSFATIVARRRRQRLRCVLHEATGNGGEPNRQVSQRVSKVHERTDVKIAGNGQAVLKRKEREKALRLAAQMIRLISQTTSKWACLQPSNNIIESKHQLLPLFQPLQRVSQLPHSVLPLQRVPKLPHSVLPHRVVADHPDRAIRLLA